MTPRRVTGPGPRTIALRPTSSRAGLASAIALIVVVAAACGSARPASPAVGGSAGPPASTGPGSPAVLGPGTSGTAGGSAAPGGSIPHWPGTTVLAVIALGAADGEIQKAGVDLQAAADAQDLKAMWGAADGLARMIDGLTPNIARLEFYPGTQPAAALYRKAFPELGNGAKQLRDSITAGDASGIVAGSQLIAQGLADYAPVREVIGGLVEQAIVQQRLLTE